MKFIILFLFTVLLIYNISYANAEDLNNIPNGTYVNTAQKSKCQICHEYSAPTTDQAQLNSFGTDYRNCGKTWGQCLADKDSDNDTYPNSVELNCTNYNWLANSGPCGSGYERATNPGDAAVTPSIAIEKKPPPVPRPDSLSVNPNPFNPRTTLSFSVSTATSYSLSIATIEGRVIRVFQLSSGDIQKGRVEWDGRDANNREAAAGIYIARLMNGKSPRTVKLVLAR